METPAVGLTLSTLITDVGTVLTALLSWIVSIFNAAISSPIVLVFIVMALIGVAVGFARKLMHV